MSCYLKYKNNIICKPQINLKIFINAKVRNTNSNWYSPMLKLEISPKININARIKNINIHQCQN
jgi:hypothetical protein